MNQIFGYKITFHTVDTVNMYDDNLSSTVAIGGSFTVTRPVLKLYMVQYKVRLFVIAWRKQFTRILWYPFHKLHIWAFRFEWNT